MSGIARFIYTECDRSSAESLTDRMCKVIRHREPNDQGMRIGDGIVIGMRRLSTIDPSSGHQSIFNEDEIILVVLNGEINNYRELQKELIQLGHYFRTNSDTEVIVQAYKEFGDDFVKHLRGMFSFALWSRTQQRLLAARDRFGKKPFNYFWDGQQLVFGSEIKSIIVASVPREINPIALDENLVYSYVSAPNTLFKNLLKLPAAHILTFENGQLCIKPLWELYFLSTCQHDKSTAIERVHNQLREAMQVRLLSEVSLGAFSSGGIDSSLVVGLMRQMMSEPVKAFSIGFEEDDYSVLPKARQIAKQFGTEHHEFFVRPNLISVLPELVWAYDEPFADSSILPTYYLSKLAREYVTFILSGDGGDEIFGGYKPYWREYLIDLVPLLSRLFLSYGSRLMPDGMQGKKRIQNLHSDSATRSVRANMLFPENSRSLLYTSEYFAQVISYNPLESQISEHRKAAHLDITSRLQYVDVRKYLADDILVKVDKASMINSLETRAPLLDQHLAEYISSLPSSIRMHNSVLKSLLKKGAADILPSKILTRPKKGFSLPIKYWFRGDLINYAYDLLDSSRAYHRGILNQQLVRELLKAHTNRKLVNYSEAVWALLCQELWFKIYIDRPGLKVERDGKTQVIG